MGARVQATVAAASETGFEPEAAVLDGAWTHLASVTRSALERASLADVLPNATLYLQGFGQVVLAWIWLDIATAASRSSSTEAPGKVAAMRYFFAYELPRRIALLDLVECGETLCRDVPAELL